MEPATVRCLVCGEGFGAPPVRCPRCQAPHHADCWEYVPGCARFACADAAPPEIGAWPLAHRLVATRSTLLTTGAVLLEGGLIGNVLAMLAMLSFGPGFTPVALGFTYTLAAMGLGLACFLAAGALAVRLALGPEAALLARLRSEGDRRLRRALEARVGHLLPWSPAAGAAGLFVLVETWILLGLLATGDPARALGDFPFFLVAGALLAGFVYFPVLRLAAWMVGSQRILLHRLADAAPSKPPLPPGAGTAA